MGAWTKMSIPKIGILLLAAATAGFCQDEEEGEEFFMNASVAIHLVGRDSIHVDFGAGAEDMVNTVGIIPFDNSDPSLFRAYERKMEAYLQDRIPVSVGGKRVYLKVIRWKPGGQGRTDGFDSASIYTDQVITLGGKLPPAHRDHIDVTLNTWTERQDAGRTFVEFTLLEGDTLLARRWGEREKRQRFAIDPESLRKMRANPPPAKAAPVPEE